MKQSVFRSKEAFIEAFSSRMIATYQKEVSLSSVRERFNILGTLVREHIAFDWIKTNELLEQNDGRIVHYFSIEFLLGRLITNNLMNLGLWDVVNEAFNELGIDLNEVEIYESDPGLGNGGLGRLAACFLDSLASLGLPGFGQCLRYQYGLFRQKIKNGYQEERPDNWLSDGYVFEIRREEEAEDVMFFGHVEYNGKMEYHPREFIRAVPYDIPIVGDHNRIVNYLRLWNAEPSRKYPKHISPYEYHEELRNISGFLYPDDTTDDGKRLRLMQQYFLSSAGVKSICRKHKEKYGSLKDLDKHVVFHINDTHPTLVIPELMRILLDEEGMEWDDAWKIVQNAIAYTNHTILAEALEQWPVRILEPLLPRIYQLIEEINRRFVAYLEQGFARNNPGLARKLAIIDGTQIRMAHLCIVASFSVNGVARLHTEILKTIEMKEFNELYPGKFTNVTNGITHRRWLIQSNPELAGLLDCHIGPKWRRNPAELAQLESHKDDLALQKAFLIVKRKKKAALARRIFAEQGLELDPDSLFD
ncbi:MAG: glycogen/starch/alpha-glucan phosphorylase, partial [Acholeplasmataceae bacterium]|nr:glycogen/starch/alpha-glucan phosphorylase [Acholeplasmataceae bacterium]